MYPLVALAIALLSATGPIPADLPRPTRDYFAYVCGESDDVVSLVRFGPSGIEELKRIPVGSFPADTEGPHGIAVTPSGSHWYVSLSHGLPFGSIHKYTTGDDEWQGEVRVGMFPATLDVSEKTGLLYVVNADFYGDMKPSTISVVETATMTEVEQIPTGVMPHGARLSRDGRLFYAVNMMDDDLVEVDALRFEIRRRLELGGPRDSSSHAGHEAAMTSTVEPAWVTAPTEQGKVYVIGLSANRIYEVDLQSWQVSRSFETPKGPYNAAVTPDSRLLVVTYKRSDAVGFWSLKTGEELAHIPTTRRVPHGVAISSDGRYSFITVEGVGGEPGVVEVYDNQALQRVAALDVGKQAGGIALWAGGH